MSRVHKKPEAKGFETVGKILSAADLAAFREGFSANRMNQLARHAVAGGFPEATPAIDMMLLTFYGAPCSAEGGSGEAPCSAGVGGPIFVTPAGLDGRERERVIIALMTSTPFDTLHLAIHVYWGLMEGLSPEEIAWTQLLTGSYRGIDKFTIGLGVLSATLHAMRDVLPRTDVDTVFSALTSHVAPLTRAATRSI